jgi:hypothetical protein
MPCVGIGDESTEFWASWANCYRSCAPLMAAGVKGMFQCHTGLLPLCLMLLYYLHCLLAFIRTDGSWKYLYVYLIRFNLVEPPFDILCFRFSPLLDGQFQLSWSIISVLNFLYLWPPVWSSGDSSWLQIQRSGFDSWRYQIFLEVVGLEPGRLSLMSTIEELLERKCSGSGLESREYSHRDPSRWPRGFLYPQKVALTSATSDGRSVGVVHSRTQATEFVLFCSFI